MLSAAGREPKRENFAHYYRGLDKVAEPLKFFKALPMNRLRPRVFNHPEGQHPMIIKKLEDAKNKQQKAHNRDLIRRMRNGDSLTSFDSTSSWYPPRPVIEKDEKALAELYGSTAMHDDRPRVGQGLNPKPDLRTIRIVQGN